MIRAAIYARFSSDLQTDRSIADQFALCRKVCAREGMAVVATFDDRAVSGSSAINRPGFQQLMRAAEARKFDVIVAEDMDRMFRDQSDYHAARKVLDFVGITIHTASGKVTKIDGALRALMGELFIENLALHTRRGLEGVIRDGRHAGGRAYGYRAVPGQPGQLEIVKEEAAIVLRIFRYYVAGKSPRDIAKALNAEGIQPPRGSTWNASTINGNLQRGGGILLNEIYVGRIVWNKVRMVKDPTTGKRISRPNPKSEHRSAAAPHLQIVDEEIWTAAQKLKTARGGSKQSSTRDTDAIGLAEVRDLRRRDGVDGQPKRDRRLQSSRFKESGTCENGRKVKRDDVERLTLEALGRELTKPVFIAEYVRTYNEERQRLARSAVSDRARLERRLGEIDRELNRAIDAIVKIGVDPTTMAGRIKDLEGEKRQVVEQLATSAETKKVISLHPAAIARYRTAVTRLGQLLPRDGLDERDELIDTLRVDSVIVHAAPNDTDLKIEIRGRLAELLEIPTFAARSQGGP